MRRLTTVSLIPVCCCYALKLAHAGVARPHDARVVGLILFFNVALTLLQFAWLKEIFNQVNAVMAEAIGCVSFLRCGSKLLPRGRIGAINTGATLALFAPAHSGTRLPPCAACRGRYRACSGQGPPEWWQGPVRLHPHPRQRFVVPVPRAAPRCWHGPDEPPPQQLQLQRRRGQWCQGRGGRAGGSAGRQGRVQEPAGAPAEEGAVLKVRAGKDELIRAKEREGFDVSSSPPGTKGSTQNTTKHEKGRR